MVRVGDVVCVMIVRGTSALAKEAIAADAAGFADDNSSRLSTPKGNSQLSSPTLPKLSRPPSIPNEVSCSMDASSDPLGRRMEPDAVDISCRSGRLLGKWWFLFIFARKPVVGESAHKSGDCTPPELPFRALGGTPSKPLADEPDGVRAVLRPSPDWRDDSMGYAG